MCTPESRPQAAPCDADSQSDVNEEIIGDHRTQPQSPASRASKAVSFQDDNTVIEIPHHKDIIRKIKRDIWLEDHEYSEMMSENKFVANKIIRGKHLQNGETGRGLDSFIPKRAFRRDRKMDNAILTVLNEQNRQRTEGRVDPDLLSEMYSKASKGSHELAISIAKEDEKEAALNETYSKSGKKGRISKKIKGAVKAFIGR